MFTRFLAPKLTDRAPRESILSNLRSLKTRIEWIEHATNVLKKIEGVQRVGVWLEPESGTASDASSTVFEGRTWEFDGENWQLEWSRLSLEAPLPAELLKIGTTVETHPPDIDAETILGPLVGLKHAVWAPVMRNHSLRGLLLIGTNEKHRTLPNATAEHVAAELALLLDLEAERLVSTGREADLSVTQRVYDLRESENDGEWVGKELVATCTADPLKGGVGAVFALIVQPAADRMAGEAEVRETMPSLRILALSGDSAWRHTVATGPLEMLWRKALSSGRTQVMDAELRSVSKDVARIVAIPLAGTGQACAVLIAGIPPYKDASRILMRLQLRAQLVAQVLREKCLAEIEIQNRSWRSALLQSSAEMVLLLDRQERVLEMSRGARELFAESGLDGQDRGPSRRLSELFGFSHREEFSRWLQVAFAGGDHHPADALRIELNDGTEVQANHLGIADGDLLVLRLEPKNRRGDGQVPAALETEFLQTLEWLSEGVMLFDSAGGIRAMNARVQQVFGLTPEEAREARTVEDLIQRLSKNAADPPKFAERWRALTTDSFEQAHDELDMRWPTAQVIARYTRQLIGEDGKKLGRVEVYQELTTRKMFESRMLQTEKLASLGQRAIGIVHELTNPMTAILGNAQRLLVRYPAGRQNPEAQRIFEEAERAVGILRQLLNSSRATQPVKQAISIQELVELTVQIQQAALAGSSIELRLDLEPNFQSIDGDFAQLQQVLLNLLQNAQQAIEQSGTGSMIGIRTYRPDENHIRVEVWDDGPGISPTIQARIYDPFFTTKSVGEGTGLGLSIALESVRQHGGTLNLLQPPARGARFVVELPIKPEIANHREQYSSESFRQQDLPIQLIQRERRLPKRSGNGVPRSNIRALVVEDEPTVAELIADLLREEGLSVDVSMDSRSALRRIDQESYQLLICDLKMPEIDGQAFYNTLLERQHPVLKHVLFVTGDVMAARSQEFLARHQLPYVTKPFRLEELSEAVHRMLPELGAVVSRGIQANSDQAAGNE